MDLCAKIIKCKTNQKEVHKVDDPPICSTLSGRLSLIEQLESKVDFVYSMRSQSSLPRSFDNFPHTSLVKVISSARDSFHVLVSVLGF